MADLVKQVGVLQPKSKEQVFALRAANLIGGRGYFMKNEDYDRLIKNKLVAPLLCDLTMRGIAIAVGHVLMNYQSGRS